MKINFLELQCQINLEEREFFPLIIFYSEKVQVYYKFEAVFNMRTMLGSALQESFSVETQDNGG